MKKFIIPTICAICAMTSCSTTKDVVNNMDITGKWTIEKAMGKTTQGTENKPFINFEKGGKMNGNAGVNNFFGSYSVKGNEVKFERTGMTLMMGPGMEVEQAVTSALELSKTIKNVDGKAVVLSEKNDTVLVLVK